MKNNEKQEFLILGNRLFQNFTVEGDQKQLCSTKICVQVPCIMHNVFILYCGRATEL